ncbi:B3 domain-containing transcription factor VRN1 [Spatholobus suberectus]|nr:B3 domain-containing transcription factor VRN1 [Spatholobus suberectus]
MKKGKLHTHTKTEIKTKANLRPLRRGARATQLQTTSVAAHHHGEDAILPIRFFKIILKSNLERLQIPNKFTKRYGGGLSNPLFIKPPDGTEWKVHWTKQNGEVWFEKGWKEFVENYSLDHGHLVFFKYGGTSQVDVLILEQSALEIDYPSCDAPEENDNLEQSDDEWPDQNTTHLRGEEATQGTLSLPLNWPREARARVLARRFISCNPFFTISIKPFHLALSKLRVPDLEGYIENKVKNVMLQLGKRSWNVKLLSCHYLGSGWHKFARGTELQLGDVCIFELICRKDPVFKVHVFKSQS